MTMTINGHPTTFFSYSYCQRIEGSFADHEPGLWRAVITQALMDAASRSRKVEARRARNDALAWLLSGESDFEAVCDNAGLDPDYVRSRARLALQRDFTWRLPVGEGWRTRGRTPCVKLSAN